MPRSRWATIAIAGAGGLSLVGVLGTLRTLSNQTEELATQVGDLGETVAEMESGLELVRQSQAGKVWVSSQVIKTIVIIRVLNPGDKTATLKVHTYKRTGAQGFLPATHTIGPGQYIVKEFLETFSGTVVLVSDRPVFPFGRVRNFDSEVLSEMSMPFFPVNCDDDTGVEWVCSHLP
jgi:hypothetical protein